MAETPKILSFLAILSASTGIFFSVTLFTLKGNNKTSNNLLALLLLIFSIRIGEFALYWTDFIEKFPHLLFISASLPFLFGVIIYFYSISVVYKNHFFSFKEVLHFVPFILFLFYFSPFYLQSGEVKLSSLANIRSSDPQVNLEFYIIRSLQISQMLVYFIITYRMIKDHLLKLANNKNELQFINLTWVNYLNFGFVFFIIVMLTHTISVGLTSYKYIMIVDSILMFSCAIMIYAAIYGIMKNPDIVKAKFKWKEKAKYSKSNLSEETVDKCIRKLKELMESEKVFKNSELKINDLAEQLSVSTHVLSQIINEKFGQNFFDFVNSYRIEEAKKMLLNPNSTNFKIISIAFEVGFNNKSSFNNAFKKFENSTPSEFRNVNQPA